MTNNKTYDIKKGTKSLKVQDKRHRIMLWGIRAGLIRILKTIDQALDIPTNRRYKNNNE